MKFIQKNALIFFSLMWIGVLVNFNSHFNDILKVYNIFFDKADNVYNIVNISNFVRAISLYLIFVFLIIFYKKKYFLIKILF